MADIQFTGDIVINTKEAEKSIANLSKQINDVFAQTGRMMNAALRTTDFGFTGVLPGYKDAIKQTEKIIEKYNKKVPRLGKNPTEEEVALHAAALARVSKAKASLKNVDTLRKTMSKLSMYDTLYGDIEQLRSDVSAGTFDPKTALGKYNVLQRYSNSLLGLLYGGRRSAPGIFTRGVLEYGEGFRDTNRKTGSTSRSEWRYIVDKAYQERAAAVAVDYMLDTSNRLNEVSSMYGVDFTRTKNKLPANLNEKYINNMESFLDTIDNIEVRKRRLDSGNLSKAQRSVEFKWLQKDLTDLTRVGRTLGGEAKKASLAIKESNDLYIAQKKSMYGGQIWRAIGGASLIGTLAHGGATMLQSYWGEQVTRSVYGSKQAYYKRWETGGGIAGGTAGALAGAAIGSVVPIIGTAVGGAVGAVLGATLGSLYGSFKSIMTQADIKSTDSMIARVRNKSVFGSSYNTYFANAMSQVTGGDGMAELANNATTLRARMMLGQVGEYDMLYYSMMPNYFSALMQGMTGPQLAKIYQRDLMAIGDPSMRRVVGEAIGGGNAFAMANNPYFNSIYMGMVGRAGQYEGAVGRMETGYLSARSHVAMLDIAKDYSAVRNSARRGDSDFYIAANESDSWLRGWRRGFSRPGDVQSRGEGITFVNVIKLPDGTEIGRDVKSADEVYIDSWSQFVGGQ